MKIGTLTTSDSYNFGAKLQCCALIEFLNQTHHTTQSINIISKEFQIKSKNLDDKVTKRREIYDRFSKKFIRSTKKITIDELYKTNFDIDLLIIGSDQVWNYDVIRGLLEPQDFKIFFGDFLKTDAVIASYAASTGDLDLSDPRFELYFRRYLRNFDFISLREYKDMNLIKNIAGECQKALDPTMLFDKEHYLKLFNNRRFDIEYIYVHQQYHQDENLKKFTCELSDKLNLPILNGHHGGASYDPFEESYPNQIGTCYFDDPFETLSAIYSTRYVITTSFHAIVFSILFNKDFYFIANDQKNNRIYELLENLDLTSRIIKSGDQIEPIAISEEKWRVINEKIKNMRIDSFKYIKKITSEHKHKKPGDYFETKDKFSCYGCGACNAICPNKVIKLTSDEEGFCFPKIGENCVKCGKCKKICPYNKKIKNQFPEEYYLAFNKNESQRANSSSGGIFGALASYIEEQKGYVGGVKWHDGYIATYDIDKAEEKNWSKFSYSKYVEAEDNNIYKKIENCLTDDKLVLMTGTPCKIAGFKNYFIDHKNYENLFLIEICCAGTNSPTSLKMWLAEKEKQHNSKLVNFSFRSPKKEWQKQAVEYTFENGKEEIVNNSDDLFHKAFYRGCLFKKSCYLCEFKASNGVGDLTIGDFWGIEKIHVPHDGDISKGVSFIKVNTEKGKRILEAIKDKIYLQEQSFWDIYQNNNHKPADLPLNRGLLEKYLKNGKIKEFFRLVTN